MRKTLLTGVASVAMFCVVGNPLPAASQEMSAVDWAGAYIGVHAGYGEANFDGVIANGSLSATFADNLDLDGFAGGIHGGFNWQFDSMMGGGHDLVVGIEGDVTLTDWDDRQNAPGTSDGSAGDVDLLASVRGRIGVAFDRVLIFGTAGIAFADAKYTGNDSGVFGDVNFNDVGGVVGGGLEWAVDDVLSFRAEGLYYFFNDKKNTSTLLATSSVGDFAELEDAFVVRVGASISLDDLFGRN